MSARQQQLQLPLWTVLYPLGDAVAVLHGILVFAH